MNSTFSKISDLVTEEVKVLGIRNYVERKRAVSVYDLLKKDKPLVIFECGLGASDYYDTDPKEIFEYLVSTVGLNVYTIKNWLDSSKFLSLEEFTKCYNTNQEYYFIAN